MWEPFIISWVEKLGTVMVEIDPDDVGNYQADSRGRINLGTEYKNQTIEVAVLSVKDEDSDE